MDIRPLAAVFAAELDPSVRSVRVDVLHFHELGECVQFSANVEPASRTVEGAIYSFAQLEQYGADLAVQAARQVNWKIQEARR